MRADPRVSPQRLLFDFENMKSVRNRGIRQWRRRRKDEIEREGSEHTDGFV